MKKREFRTRKGGSTKAPAPKKQSKED